MFASRVKLPKSIPVPSGRSLVPINDEIIDNDGNRRLIETGKRDLNSLIQESKDECDVYSIIRRYENGDLSILDRRNGFYADIINQPRTLAEAQQELIKASRLWDSLPLELRSKYDNSMSKFLRDINNPDLEKYVGKIIEDNPTFVPVKKSGSAAGSAEPVKGDEL